MQKFIINVPDDLAEMIRGYSSETGIPMTTLINRQMRSFFASGSISQGVIYCSGIISSGSIVQFQIGG